MEKFIFGFVLGFLACTWTYELDAGKAFLGFGRKFMSSYDEFLDHQQEQPGAQIPLPLSAEGY